MRNLEYCFSLGKTIPIMAMDPQSCRQYTLRILSQTFSPQCHLTSVHQVNSSCLDSFHIRLLCDGDLASDGAHLQEGDVLVILTSVWQLYGKAWTILLSTLILCSGLVNFFIDDHVLRSRFVLCVEDTEAQDTKSGEGIPRGSLTFQLGLLIGSQFALSQTASTFLHSRTLDSFPT